MSKLQANSMPVNATGRYQFLVRPTILLLLLQLMSPFFQHQPSVVQAIAPPTCHNASARSAPEPGADAAQL